MVAKPATTWDGLGLEVLHTGDFDGTHLKRKGVYSVCFGATWCPPTRRFVPKFVARSGKYPGTFAIGDITDWDDPLWDTFRIKITPTMVIFRDGRPVERFDGRRLIGLREHELDELGAILTAK